MSTTNRLAQSTSPYLRQHADNPVHWQPWDDEALARARDEDLPILLSVGYSACHWCHVMAHESFEDPAVAEVMNTGFVCVKVDREERPDVDAVYMEAVQAISGSGGWPMTVFLLPDGRPFFGGTYFPRDRFVDLMQRVSAAWTARREGLEADADRMADWVRAGTGLPSTGWASDGDPRAGRGPGVLDATVAGLLARHDREWGGFGDAPKFPQPTMVEALLAAWVRDHDPVIGEAVTTTLDAMASGGIYDHLAGGFARYSTDRRWLVPHFEKMLYDNALAVRVYLHGWSALGHQRWLQVVTETVGYLLSPPLRLAAGAWASAEDADAEGVEGRYSVWSDEEVRSVAGDETAEWYGVTPAGNWEGATILTRPERGVLERPAAVEAGRRALLERRSTRVAPGLDDKVLTEWNAMGVAALAEAGVLADRPDWVAAAVTTARFLLAHLRRDDGRWLRSWQSGPAGGPDEAGGRAQHLAYAGDYAWLVEAFTRLAEATGHAEWIDLATQTADDLIDLFADGEAGGFATTGSDAEALVARPKDTYDGAVPSANSVATMALLRLHALTGDPRPRAAAESVLSAMAPALGKAPTAFTALAVAADLADRGMTEVVVSGDRPDLLAVVRGRWRPEAVVAWGEPWDSPLWEGRADQGADGRGYVCRDFTCSLPAGTPEELATRLGT